MGWKWKWKNEKIILTPGERESLRRFRVGTLPAKERMPWLDSCCVSPLLTSITNCYFFDVAKEASVEPRRMRLVER